eukprot:g3845.t1
MGKFKFNHPAKFVSAALRLRADGCTVPFIARYRRDDTGSLSAEKLQSLFDAHDAWTAVETRKDAILRKLRETYNKDGKCVLTSRLEDTIAASTSLQALEDLFLPFRAKRCTAAEAAREHGLEPLALRAWRNDSSRNDTLNDSIFLHELSAASRNASISKETALQGILHLIAEKVAESAPVRSALRTLLWHEAFLCSTAKNVAKKNVNGKYRDYHNFRRPLQSVKPYQVLAINRGVTAKCLKVKIQLGSYHSTKTLAAAAAVEKRRISKCIRATLGNEVPNYSKKNPQLGRIINDSFHDAWKRLLRPSLFREIQRDLKKRAEKHAANVFAQNGTKFRRDGGGGTEQIRFHYLFN